MGSMSQASFILDDEFAAKAEEVIKEVEKYAESSDILDELAAFNRELEVSIFKLFLILGPKKRS